MQHQRQQSKRFKNSIVVEDNKDEDESDFTGDVKTFFCNMCIADVSVRTMYSNVYCANGICSAAIKLMDRMGYDSSGVHQLCEENKPKEDDKQRKDRKKPNVVLEGVARLLAYAPETRAGAMCLLSVSPCSHLLFMEDLVDAGLKNETLGPVAEFQRNKHAQANA